MLLCPFGCEQASCDHFIGWTDDGRMIQMRRETPDSPPRPNEPIKDGDRIVKTGVSARVYRLEK